MVSFKITTDALLMTVPESVISVTPVAAIRANEDPTTSISSIPDDFPQFEGFPEEIRHEIWRACLPSRVIRLSLVTNLHKHQHIHKHCDHKQGPCEHQRLPVISKVCHESRSVVFEWGRFLPKSHCRVLPIWFDSSSDLILLNLNNGFLVFDRPLGQLFSHLPRASKRNVVVDDTKCWHHGEIAMPGHFRALFTSSLYSVAIAVLEININISNDDAAALGIFDQHGDTRSTVIHASDFRTLKRLYACRDLWSWEEWGYTRPRKYLPVAGDDSSNEQHLSAEARNFLKAAWGAAKNPNGSLLHLWKSRKTYQQWGHQFTWSPDGDLYDSIRSGVDQDFVDVITAFSTHRVQKYRKYLARCAALEADGFTIRLHEYGRAGTGYLYPYPDHHIEQSRLQGFEDGIDLEPVLLVNRVDHIDDPIPMNSWQSMDLEVSPEDPAPTSTLDLEQLRWHKQW